MLRLCSATVLSDSPTHGCSPPLLPGLGFSRQGYWSGLLCPPPEDLPNAGMEPVSLASLALANGSSPTNATLVTAQVTHPGAALVTAKLPHLSLTRGSEQHGLAQIFRSERNWPGARCSGPALGSSCAPALPQVVGAPPSPPSQILRVR